LQHFLSPEKSIQIQSVLGSDITLALDQVVNAQADRPTAKQAMERTFRWAQRCRQEFTRLHQSNLRIDLGNLDAPWLPQPQPNKYGEIDHQQLAKYERAKTRWHLHTSQPFSPQTDLSSKNSNSKVIFGIPQGAQYKDLRRESARQIKALDFPGYSIGGVAQGGEPAEVMYDQVQTQTEILEDQKPRHLLGVGTPEDIIATVRRGVDMFDCVYPTRNARHGTLFFWTDHERLAYETVKIRSRRFHKDFTPINPESTLPELRTYTKAYLSHLVQTGEALASYLATLHNLEFYQQLMRQIREKIRVGEL
jgi:queuine tRNA-ribosyltransferase